MHRGSLSPLSTFVICGALGLSAVACDKEKSDDGDAKSEDASEAKADGEKADDKKADDKTDDAAAEKAALEAELAAAKEELEAAKARNEELAKELDTPEEPEDDVAHEHALAEGEKGPVSVANVEVAKETGQWGTTKGRLQAKLSVDLTLNKKQSGGVYAKASCLVGTDVYVDVTTVSNEYGDLGKMNEGETKRVDAMLYGRAGLDGVPTRCELAFDYGASEFSVRVADYCYDGSAVTEGKCAEPVKATVQGTGKVVPFAFAVSVEDAASFMDPSGDKKNLHVYYGARFNEHLEHAPHMSLKTACKVGDKVWVEVSPDFPHVKPFSLENGEIVPLGHGQFFSNPLPGAPEWCQMDVHMSEGFGQSEVVIATACWKGGDVADGTCRDMPPAAAPEPMSADSLSLDGLTFHWTADYKDASKVVFNMDLAATMAKAVEQWMRMTATVSCDGKADKKHTFGPDLAQVLPGESFAVTMSAFWQEPLAGVPKQCEVVIGGEKFGSDPAEVAKICIYGDKAELAACPKKAKKAGEAKVGEKVEIAF